MSSDNLKALVAYRVGQADEALQSATLLLEDDLLRSALNRAYYAMFYAILALLASQKKETSKHAGAIALFDRDYVKPGIFPRELSRWVHDGFDLRQRSDYAVRYVPSREETEELINNAASFVRQVRQWLKEEGAS